MHVFTRIFASAVMLAPLCIGAHADTSTDGRPASITGRRAVYYGDLDLSAERGAKIMLQRIERAAKQACGGHATFSSYTGSLDSTYEECRRKAILRAVKELDAPVVTRLYAQARPQ